MSEIRPILTISLYDREPGQRLRQNSLSRNLFNGYLSSTMTLTILPYDS